MTTLSLSRLHFPVTTLGPGRRIGVWFQGCSIRCPGCISLDTWEPHQGMTSVEAIFDAFESHLDQADGLTISGGEPFEQPDALRELLIRWRSRHMGDVLVYSGYPFESLASRLVRFDSLIDALVSDPLRLDVPQTLPLRGSDNQRLHLLTPLGEARFHQFHAAQANQHQQLDMMIDDVTGTVFLAGIPRRGDLTRLKAILQAAGHQAASTEDKTASDDRLG